MILQLSDLVKDREKIDLKDICSTWTWLIAEQKHVLFVSVFGDIFFLGPKSEVNWLDCGAGELTKVARTLTEFQNMLGNKDSIAEWFLTDLYIELQEKKILLKENEVYGYKKLPILGGEYRLDNIQPIDMTVHFHSSGKICEEAMTSAEEDTEETNES
ncbi:hypothetical protein CNR22_08960 [Sphingobacteriaceae bacterium]|nr:hypothetical protein CNR22_08960 [Sphingobacteriaceae bacterium]